MKSSVRHGAGNLSIIRRAALVLSLSLLAGGTLAADYPTKTIRLVVPYTPGGATDAVGRIIAQQLTQRLGQPVVVENKPGAGGNIGTQAVATAAPDGYTLLFSTTANAINESLYKRLPFNFPRDFKGVSQLVELPNVLIVNNELPAKSVQELIAICRAKPGGLSYASAGAGTSTHLAAELFKSMAKVSIVHIPYRGSSPAMIDLRTGAVQLMFDNLPSALPQIKAGAVRALAVTSARPAQELPNVPTLAAAGVPGYEAVAWHGISVPAHTPDDIVKKLNAEIDASLKDPEVVRQLAAIGATAKPSSVEDFARHVARETAKWERVVKASGAVID